MSVGVVQQWNLRMNIKPVLSGVTLIQLSSKAFTTKYSLSMSLLSASRSDTPAPGLLLLATNTVKPRRLIYLKVRASSRFMGSIPMLWSQWCSPPIWAVPSMQANLMATPSTCMPARGRPRCAYSAVGSMEPSPLSQLPAYWAVMQPASNSTDRHI